MLYRLHMDGESDHGTPHFNWLYAIDAMTSIDGSEDPVEFNLLLCTFNVWQVPSLGWIQLEWGAATFLTIISTVTGKTIPGALDGVHPWIFGAIIIIR